MNELIECKTCHAQIACMAEACPSCGAPNDWLHSGVQHFLKVKDSGLCAYPWVFTTTKTTIKGQTLPRAPLWAKAWLTMFILFAAMAWLTAAFMWFVICIFLGVLVYAGSKKTETFEADCAQRTWSSSNDKLWQRLRSELRL